MPVVTVSPRYQVVIPKDVREELGIRPGHVSHLWLGADARPHAADGLVAGFR